MQDSPIDYHMKKKNRSSIFSSILLLCVFIGRRSGETLTIEYDVCVLYGHAQ
jgi:hypothetical protein